MDPTVFNEEVFNQLELNGLGTTLNMWREEKERIKQASQIATMAPDHLLIQAALITRHNYQMDEIDAVAPDFSSHLTAYRELQHILLEDLVKVQKAVQKRLTLFRQYLT